MEFTLYILFSIFTSVWGHTAIFKMKIGRFITDSPQSPIYYI